LITKKKRNWTPFIYCTCNVSLHVECFILYHSQESWSLFINILWSQKGYANVQMGKWVIVSFSSELYITHAKSILVSVIWQNSLNMLPNLNHKVNNTKWKMFFMYLESQTFSLCISFTQKWRIFFRSAKIKKFEWTKHVRPQLPQWRWASSDSRRAASQSRKNSQNEKIG
jgi:hypothetical protein